MPLSVSKKEWEEKRPKDAKASGVGSAVDGVLASEKLLKTLGLGEKARKSVETCTEALNNIETLREALTTGEGKAKGKFKTKEDQEKFENMLEAWRKNLKTFEAEVMEKAKDACTRVADYDGDIEAARLLKDVMGVRVAVRKFAEQVEKAGDNIEPLRGTFAKIREAATMCARKVDGKDTVAGMRRYLGKILSGDIARGYITLGELPDPGGRDLLAVQVGELEKEYEPLEAKFG